MTRTIAMTQEQADALDTAITLIDAARLVSGQNQPRTLIVTSHLRMLAALYRCAAPDQEGRPLMEVLADWDDARPSQTEGDTALTHNWRACGCRDCDLIRYESLSEKGN